MKLLKTVIMSAASVATVTVTCSWCGKKHPKKDSTYEGKHWYCNGACIEAYKAREQAETARMEAERKAYEEATRIEIKDAVTSAAAPLCHPPVHTEVRMAKRIWSDERLRSEVLARVRCTIEGRIDPSCRATAIPRSVIHPILKYPVEGCEAVVITTDVNKRQAVVYERDKGELHRIGYVEEVHGDSLTLKETVTTPERVDVIITKYELVKDPAPGTGIMRDLIL